MGACMFSDARGWLRRSARASSSGFRRPRPSASRPGWVRLPPVPLDSARLLGPRRALRLPHFHAQPRRARRSRRGLLEGPTLDARAGGRPPVFRPLYVRVPAWTCTTCQRPFSSLGIGPCLSTSFGDFEDPRPLRKRSTWVRRTSLETPAVRASQVDLFSGLNREKGNATAVGGTLLQLSYCGCSPAAAGEPERCKRRPSSGACAARLAARNQWSQSRRPLGLQWQQRMARKPPS